MVTTCGLQARHPAPRSPDLHLPGGQSVAATIPQRVRRVVRDPSAACSSSRGARAANSGLSFAAPSNMAYSVCAGRWTKSGKDTLPAGGGCTDRPVQRVAITQSNDSSINDLSPCSAFPSSAWRGRKNPKNRSPGLMLPKPRRRSTACLIRSDWRYFGPLLPQSASRLHFRTDRDRRR